MIRIALATAAVLLLGPVPSAMAFDCSKAVTLIEKEICGDPALKAADSAMADAYARLRAGMGDEQRQALKRDQVDWLRRREYFFCEESVSIASPVDRACLLHVTQQRTRLLSGTPDYAERDAPRFTPFFYNKVDEGRQIEIFMIWPEAVGPGMNPLNGLIGQATLGGEVDVDLEMGPYSNIMSYRIRYASGRLISIVLDGYEYTGGAHGMSYAIGINYLPEAGRALTLDDFLDDRGKAALIPLCRAAIAAEKRAREVPEELIDSSLSDDALADSIKTIGAWSFGHDGAQIHYDAYALGSYAEGAYDCPVSWADLKSVAKWGASLPFE